MARRSKSTGSAQKRQEAAQEPPVGRDKGQSDGRRGVLVRLPPARWKQLKLIAIDREITLQDLMEEAVDDVLRKHGKPPQA